ncbi:MAG: hypothetical protein E4H30_00955 [Methanomassiliicoccus sp.]|nr:MAG: hypothetical protein E4H30_00955 [Methanomassiliicoccus sp.]
MSKTLSSLGGFVGKRPLVSILIILMITALSVFSVAFNGINSSFANSDFMPENEVSMASSEISETFALDYSITVLVKGAEGDMITQRAFLDVLEAEAAVMGNTTLVSYLSTASINPYSSVISPVDMIASAMLMSMNETQVAQVTGLTQVPTYDNLIKLMGVTYTSMLKGVLYELLASPDTPVQVKTFLPRMFTADFDPSSTSPEAKGALVLYSFSKDQVDVTIPALDLEQALKTEMGTGGEGAIISVLGMAIINDSIMTVAMDSISNLFPIAVLAIVVILLLIYRDLLDTFIGLMGLGIAIIWMYGFGTALGFSFNPMTMIVPIILLGLGIDYSIHLVMRYREERAAGEDPQSATKKTMLSVGEALVLATVTTVIAFLSNVTSSMQAIAEFGILTAVGIISSFVVMVMLIPATKVLRDARNERKGKESKHYQKKVQSRFSAGRFNSAVGKMTHKAPWAVIGVALLVTAAAGYGAISLKTIFNLNDFLPETMDEAKDINFLSNEFNITSGSTAQVLVKGELTDPSSIIAMESSIIAMADVEGVLLHGENADVSSFLSVMYDFATDSTGPGYVDPNYNETFAMMYDGVFESSGGTAHIRSSATVTEVNVLVGMMYMGEGSAASMVQVLIPSDEGYTSVLTVNIDPNLEGAQIEQLNGDLNVAVQPIKDAGLTAVVTGEIILTQMIMKELNASQTQSLITTLVASLLIMTLVMWLLRRSYVLGALATIPVALCVVWMWGTMYSVGIPMNVMTLMIASLTVGMGVTYGIHITHRFVEEIHEHEDIEMAVDNAVGKTGVSLLGAAMTTVVGFGIIAFSILPPIQEFGLITAIAITYSFVASVFVLPAFLVIWAKARAKRKAA